LKPFAIISPNSVHGFDGFHGQTRILLFLCPAQRAFAWIIKDFAFESRGLANQPTSQPANQPTSQPAN
jgi:hypothetical protein